MDHPSGHRTSIEFREESSRHQTSPNPNRVFVGGLPTEMTESQLYNYFRKFGVLTECEIPKTIRGKKKKFGYVAFQTEHQAQAVLLEPQHFILSSPIQVEPALSTVEIFHEQLRKSKCKLFVSGDLIAMSELSLIFNEISAFGKVEKVKKLRTDKRSFNSCFVTMKTIADAEYLLEQKSLVLPNLHKVTFKRFVPRGRAKQEETLQVDPFIENQAQSLRSIQNEPGVIIGSTKFIGSWQPTECSSLRKILLRPGLTISCRLERSGEGSHFKTSAGKTSRGYKILPLESANLRCIQYGEVNLRFNILPSHFDTYKCIVMQN